MGLEVARSTSPSESSSTPPPPPAEAPTTTEAPAPPTEQLDLQDWLAQRGISNELVQDLELKYLRSNDTDQESGRRKQFLESLQKIVQDALPESEEKVDDLEDFERRVARKYRQRTSAPVANGTTVAAAAPKPNSDQEIKDAGCQTYWSATIPIRTRRTSSS